MTIVDIESPWARKRHGVPSGAPPGARETPGRVGAQAEGKKKHTPVEPSHSAGDARRKAVPDPSLDEFVLRRVGEMVAAWPEREGRALPELLFWADLDEFIADVRRVAFERPAQSFEATELELPDWRSQRTAVVHRDGRRRIYRKRINAVAAVERAQQAADAAWAALLAEEA